MSEDPRAALRRHGLSPKAAFSQNFLVSTSAVRTIVAAAAPAPGERIVELGAGLGTLTAALIEAGAHVTAIERDPDMIHVLTEDLVPKGLVLKPGDAADVDYAALKSAPDEKLCVVGNLPYAITGAILRNLCDSRAHLSRAIVMVQREVRDRLIAGAGTAEYGALTVFTTAAFDVQTVLKLPPSAFHPQPKVHSAVIRLDVRAKPRAEETAAFRTVVKAAFEQRRKTLRNALRAAIGQEPAEAALSAAAIDPMRRGETLTVEEFAHLAACVPEAR